MILQRSVGQGRVGQGRVGEGITGKYVRRLIEGKELSGEGRGGRGEVCFFSTEWEELVMGGWVGCCGGFEKSSGRGGVSTV